jgi:hypothetical protein
VEKPDIIINEAETVVANIAATLAKPIIAEAVRQCGVADRPDESIKWCQLYRFSDRLRVHK